MNSDIDLIVEGNVITMATQQPRAKAVGIKDGRIAAVGAIDEVRKREGKTTECIDLRGKTILPGFVDTHLHPSMTGVALDAVDLSSVKSIGEALENIRERVKATKAGEAVLCFMFDSTLVKEERFPNKEELDQISTENYIVVLQYDLHAASMNSSTFTLLDFPPDLEGVHKSTSGEPNGFIEDPATLYMFDKIGKLTTAEEDFESIIITAKEALKFGITTLHMKENFDTIKYILQNEHRLPVRIKPLVLLHPFTQESLNEVIQSDILNNGGCIAILSDGAIDGRTAAVNEPYADDPTTLGMLYYNDAELENFIEVAHNANLQISIHAEADRSIEQVLTAFEKALKRNPRADHRHRIEHFEIPTIAQIKRTARAGICLAMQPMFIGEAYIGKGQRDAIRTYEKLLGKERVKRSNAFRSILNEGNLVSGGSDSPVTHMDPLGGIQACMVHPNKAERISLYEAIQLFTINAAKIGFEEKLKGSIEVGKLADFAILSEDPFNISVEEIAHIAIDMTMLGGNVVYRREVD